MPATDTTALKKKTRIVAATKLPGVPEGTGGVVGDNVGMALIRYRVVFDNGVALTSVTHTKLVLEDEWDEVQAERQRAATDAAEHPAPAPDAASSEPTAEPSAAPADDRMAALLARSKAAKEKRLG